MGSQASQQTSCTNPIRSDSDRIGWHMMFAYSYLHAKTTFDLYKIGGEEEKEEHPHTRARQHKPH